MSTAEENSLAARVAALEDREAILALLHGYVHALDTADADAFEALWDEDAVLSWPDDEPFVGRADIRRAIEGTKGRFGPSGKHLMTSPVIDLQGAEARAET